ncbi:TonB-dependent receptor [Oryzicola mucosus]|uniref:TonB-dependent receptor n=1 Tax=Oryzicola mucosus TaxID=2767425 RepID=A0A8J6PXH9_9HYPH|nr:TonB-dependent receptor [Oryzicola mucosus]MBD0417091.1 TonB-dependent receptor [Oryzicola mucosus]
MSSSNPDSQQIGQNRLQIYHKMKCLARVSLLAIVATSAVRANVQEAIVLEPIVITARKTEEQIRQVPQSITVVRQQDIENNALDSSGAIAATSPNVVWQNSTVARQFFSIRGISSLGVPNNFSDGTIGFTVDGIPQSMMSSQNMLFDIDHVEVLRGPQGTLWGTNALGGAINVTTKQPDGEHEVKITTEYGEHGYAMGEATLGGVLIPDALNGRMAIRFNHFDGDIDSLFTDDLGARKIGAFRGGLQFNGLDDTTITLTGNYLRDNSNAPFSLLRGAPGFPISGVVTEPDYVTTHADVGLNIKHEFENFSLTSITAFQNNKIKSRTEANDILIPSFFPLVGSNVWLGVDKEKSFSQEIRLNSLEEDDIRWVVGASLNYSDLDHSCTAPQCAPFPYSGLVTMNTNLRAWNLGLFGDASVPLGEKWEVSFGGRLGHDDIKVKKTNDLRVPSLIGNSDADGTYLTGRAALAYKWSETAETYVSIARGHGTKIYPLFSYPNNGIVADAYPAAENWTYELGTKVALFDDRLELDGSVFHNDVKNGVLSYFDPGIGGFATTFQSYETSGFELQARAAMTDELSFNAGLGYTHTRLGSDGASSLFEGNRVPNIPEWSVSVGLAYETDAEMAGLPGSFNAAIDYQYRSSRPADVQSTFDLDAYHIVNARIGWKNDGGDFEIYGFGRNLLDERYEKFGAAGSFGRQVVSVSQGRVLGVGISKSF